MTTTTRLLTTSDHSRTDEGMRYVYPVVSRRAGGVSVGINLNPNNACNWRCIYCQVPDLQRGGPPPIDLDRLASELGRQLDDIVSGDFLATRVAPEYRRLVDIAFSGNGEPTSAAEFPAAVDLALAALASRNLLGTVKLRLITNGSLMDRPPVLAALERMAGAAGEVWFKVDAGDPETMHVINGIEVAPDTVARRLAAAAGRCPTWVQTCLFAFDGQLPSPAHLDGLSGLIGRCQGQLQGIHLYGLARPSAQPEASRLSAVSAAWLEMVAERLRRETGLTVEVSP